MLVKSFTGSNYVRDTILEEDRPIYLAGIVVVQNIKHKPYFTFASCVCDIIKLKTAALDVFLICVNTCIIIVMCEICKFEHFYCMLLVI